MDLEYSFDGSVDGSVHGSVHGDVSSAVSPTTKTKSRKGSAGQSSKTFGCPTCGQQFSRQAILNEHIRAEHLQERVNCTICGIPFKRQNDRRRHETFQHLRKRAFQCKNGGFGCGKRFTRMDSLREHQANPKKAGTTCEQAMLFAKAAPSSLQHIQGGSSEPESFMPIMSRAVGPPAPAQAPALQQQQQQPPPPPPPPPHELDPRLSPVTSDSKALAAVAALSREPRSWLEWQMDLPQKRMPDPSMIPSSFSWPSVPESRLRHTAADLAACLTASLTSQEMPPLQYLVAQHQDLVWNVPEPTMYDESGMWGSINWPKAYECRNDEQ